MKNPFHSQWRTIGLKVMNGHILLRMQLHEATKLTRVQRKTCIFWHTLSPELSTLEALLFNSPARLALRKDTDETAPVATNNVLPAHYEYVPLTDSRSKLYIVSCYATVEGGCFYDEHCGWLFDDNARWFDECTNRWRAIDEFFAK